MKHLLFAALLGSTAMIPVAASAQQAQPQPGQPQQQQAQQGQQQGQLQEMAVADLMERQVVTQQGQTIGTVAGVVQRQQDRFVVIEMEQGEARMLLPLDRVNLRGEQLVAQVQQNRIMGAERFGEQQQAQVQQVEEREMVQVRAQDEAQMAQMQQEQQQRMQDPTGALISVDQQPAQVMVEQQQPQIIVRQSPPNIIVQQSQPEIIVRMPEPQVAVRQPDPEVQVEQAQPRVTTDSAQAMVRTQQAQPQVTFERTGEPQIQFQEEAGQPRIRVERMAQGEQQQPAEQQMQAQRDTRDFFGVGQEPQATGAIGTPQQQEIAVSEIEGREVYNYQDEELGTVERVIQDPQNQQYYVVVSHGGFLGLGSDEVVMPLERLVMQGDDRLMIQGVTEEDLEAMADAERYTQYPEADGNIALNRMN